MNEHLKLLEKIKSLKNFSHINDIKLIEIIKKVEFCKYKKNRILYYQGDQAEYVYLILSGLVKKIKYRSDYSSILVGRALSGDWLGLSEVILKGQYLVDVILEKESELIRISKRNLLVLLQNNFLKDIIIYHLSKNYYNIHSNLETYTPLEKIINFIKAKIELDNKKKFIINITQENLAEIIGYTRETVNKSLKILENKKIINIKRGQIEVIDYNKLLNFE